MALVTRTLFPDWMTTAALPWLEEIIDQGRKVRPEEFQPYFRMMTTDKAHLQFTSMGTLGTFMETDEGNDVTFDNPNQGFDKTVTPLQYSLGIEITRLAIDDDKMGPIKNLATHLGRSYTETRNILAADIFNNGFNSTFTGADGVELFSTAHLLDGSSITFNNELDTPADLTVDSLRTALIDFRDFRDGRNKRINLRPNKLIVPPAVEFDAIEILGSTLRSDTAENAKNAFPSQDYALDQGSIRVWNYVTDPDAWFLQAPEEDHGLVFLSREEFNTTSDVNPRNRNTEITAWARFVPTWVNNGIGIFGSPGA